ncbi:hypothetical protein [Streptomyces sp. NPDC093707]|uniref:hypothetical protein n=1 Tax=Streptomyces sp. NPDC093707 TaxID=3154984 RepID=UPI00344F1D76
MAAGYDIVTPYPGRAVTWMRNEVRLVAAGMFRESDRAKAMAWLDDLTLAGAAVRELRAGAYGFTLTTSFGTRWMWMAHRVSELPHLTVTGDHRTPTKQMPIT